MNFRENNIQKLEKMDFDALIVGAGINGAVSASALASKGLRVALIDRGDFSSFTSQESSNLVWGGIKYMETLEFGLVRKLCMSRNQLLRQYPSSIKEIRFFVNIEKGFRFPPLFLYLGGLLYHIIGNFFLRAPRFLTVKRIATEEPVVDTKNSAGGFEYSDAYLVDNDARFVFRFIRTAMNHGAIAANYVESLGGTFDGKQWQIRLRDVVTGREFMARSRSLINACGPYVDEHNDRAKVETLHRHLFSRGIHLMLDRITPSPRVLTFFADDGRLFFIIPMGPKSCVGTTDTRTESLPAVVTPEDRNFVLQNINKRLVLKQPFTEKDIIAERCGVRPLVVNKTKKSKDKGDWVSLSRKHIIEVDQSRSHISIFGGKLTDCINVGEEIVQNMKDLGFNIPYPDFQWFGEPADAVREEFFHQARLMDLDAMTAKESSENLSTRLWRRYESPALQLLEEIRQDPAMAEVLIKGTEYIRAEIHYAARHEMIVKLEDFLRRRSKISLLETTRAIRASPGLMEACRILFGERADAEFDAYFQGATDSAGSGGRLPE
ncbi:MAG: glycerol-3-phosphate dehydrogenase/oxidase [Spirochaetales bacterium]|nr:glycerol-3-phosphate dehydrogenase/oxidase [Spirochaetales bacterium]